MDVQAQIVAAADQYGVDPALALAVAEQESNFDNSRRGGAGEVGIFQLMPGTAGDLGVDASTIAGNIEGGVRYLAQQLARFGDAATALWAYNAGPGNVERGVLPASTTNYIAAVMSKRDAWSPFVEYSSDSADGATPASNPLNVPVAARALAAGVAGYFLLWRPLRG